MILAVLLPLEEKVKIRMLSNNYIKIKIQGWTSWDTLKRTRLCLPKLYYVSFALKTISSLNSQFLRLRHTFPLLKNIFPIEHNATSLFHRARECRSQFAKAPIPLNSKWGDFQSPK